VALINDYSEDVFSSRSSLDTIFHAMNRDSSDSVDVLVVGFDDGTVHLRIFDSFEIGSFQILSAAEKANACDILLHASHPMSSTHALLVVDHSEQSQKSTRLLTLDLRFITKSGRYLSLLASKTTQLQNLLRYISQAQWQIQLEWKNTQDLPARFIRSANEDLHRKCHCDFVTAAYHLVVTGDCFEPLKEFLVEVVGERVLASILHILKKTKTQIEILSRSIENTLLICLIRATNAGKRRFRLATRMCAG
jgi:anaphase-promoting complex subunit 4